MKIEWINHASFVVEYASVRLITDPWIQGLVFNNSWAHVSPTRFTYEDFHNISHIWFSHEHPDHFNPPDLNRIDRRARARISILFQQTLDRKVIDYCTRAGFASPRELEPGMWHSLPNGMRLVCDKTTNETDSWLYLRTDQTSLLNLNDCVFRSIHELERIKRLVGTVDVLFTQFSYANWQGNRDDVRRRQAAAHSKIEQMRVQIAVLRPRYVVPSASYVWFCNENNFFMNDATNRIDHVFAALSAITEAVPMVLYPGDVWTVGSPHDSRSSIERYITDHERALRHPHLFHSPKIDLEILHEAADIFRRRSLDLNVRRKLLGYRPCRIFLTDHTVALAFSFKTGLQRTADGAEDCDVAVGSQALKYCFDHTWGFDTLLVSGMFEKPPRGVFRNFEEYQWVAHLNNHGRRLEGPIARGMRSLRALLARGMPA
jgi:hypothetical protein